MSEFNKSYIVTYDDGVSNVKGFNKYQNAFSFFEQKIKEMKNLRGIEIFKRGYKDSTDYNNLIVWWDKGRGYWSNMSKKFSQIIDKKYKADITESVSLNLILEKQIFEDVSNYDETQLKEKYNQLGYDFEISELNNRPVVKITKFTPKGRYSKQKNIIYTYVREPISYLKNWLTNVMNNLQSREDEKQKRKQELSDVGNPYKIGDLLYDTWGYEQTNVEFYEVVEVKGMTITIQELGHISVEGTEYQDSVNVKPDRNKKISEPIIKRLGRRLNNGYPTVTINSVITLSYYNESKYPKGVYKSWGY